MIGHYKVRRVGKDVRHQKIKRTTFLQQSMHSAHKRPRIRHVFQRKKGKNRVHLASPSDRHFTDRLIGCRHKIIPKRPILFTYIKHKRHHIITPTTQPLQRTGLAAAVVEHAGVEGQIHFLEQRGDLVFGAEYFFTSTHFVELIFPLAGGEDVIILRIKFLECRQWSCLSVAAFFAVPNARATFQHLAQGGNRKRRGRFVHRLSEIRLANTARLH